MRDLFWTGVQVAGAVALVGLFFEVRDRFGFGWGVAAFIGVPLVPALVFFAVAFVAHRIDRKRLMDEEFRD